SASAPALAPSERRQASLLRWQALPVETTPPPRRAERFCALSAEAAAGARLGGTRPQRTLELFKAAADGDVPRLRALVEAGVDVDAANEYGQTALHVAAWRGRASAVRLLCGWAGADPRAAAHGGATAASVAAAR
ncbi:unnamed protein product, partial [Prorocentrum cordatum]